jgi:hypothetical protein
MLDEIQSWIDKLDQVESISDELQAAGIIGVPQNIKACLIAKYLKMKTGNQDITVSGSHAYDDESGKSYPLSEKIRDVITKFDSYQMNDFIDHNAVLRVRLKTNNRLDVIFDPYAEEK